MYKVEGKVIKPMVFHTPVSLDSVSSTRMTGEGCKFPFPALIPSLLQYITPQSSDLHAVAVMRHGTQN